MKAFTKLLVLGAALTVSTSLAYADTLGIGSISFTGVNSFTANSLTFWGSQTADLAYNSLGSFQGYTASFNNLTSLSPLVESNPSAPFFSVNNGTDTLSFFMTALDPVSTTANDFYLAGTGYMTETVNAGGATLFMDTPAGITYSSQGTSGVYPTSTSLVTFSSTASITPEPSSLLLLGTGLLGAAGIARRKFAAKFVA